MKNIFLLLASLASLHLRGQIIPGQGGSIANTIWYCTFTVTPDHLGATTACNYQAAVIKDVNNAKHLVVVNSDNWLAGTKTYPTALAIYETPGNVFIVALDYENKLFKFYPWNATTISGPPHHTNTVLNFIGNDKKPYAIEFNALVGR